MSDSEIVFPDDISDIRWNEFNARVDTVLKKEPAIITIDCSNLVHVVSKHIELLWITYDSCKNESIPLQLKSPSRSLLRLLKLLDLADFFSIVSAEAGNNYSDHFNASNDNTATAMEQFCRYMTGINVPEIVEFELKTLFYEVAMNIVQHSGLEPTDIIDFSAKPIRTGMMLTFKDNGEPFDPTDNVPLEDLREAARNKQQRGLGITIINRIADKMKHERKTNGLNILTIEKYWGGI